MTRAEPGTRVAFEGSMRERNDLTAFDHSEQEDPTALSSAAEDNALEWEALEVTEEIAALPYSY